MAGAVRDARASVLVKAGSRVDLKVLGGMLALGVVCALVAVTGAPIKAFGIEFPGVTSPWGRSGVGVFGAGLIGAAVALWWRPEHPATRPPGEAGVVAVESRAGVAAQASMAGAWPRPRLTPRFTGRDRLLTELCELLAGGRPVVLAGLAGVGKTQLALAHLDRHRDEYTIVGWLRAEQAATLTADYAALAGYLDLPGHAALDHDQATDAVRRWLAGHRGWLLIFDNAETAASIAPFLPEGSGGHVIVTSRDPRWRDCATVKVDVWSREESLAFLAHDGMGDAAAGAELAERLGDLPLALEQALAYLQETGVPVADYLTLLREREPELLARGRASGYEQPVAGTWAVSLERVRDRAPGAGDLLTLWAFLAPDGIPRELVPDHLDLLPKRLRVTAGDRLAYQDAVAALTSYSLVTATAGSVGVHRLVQTVVRHSLDLEQEKRWAGVAVQLVAAVFPEDSGDVHTWEVCERLLPHTLAAAGHAERLGAAPETASRVLDRAATYLWGHAQLATAR
jgi:hypothetical protein